MAKALKIDRTKELQDELQILQDELEGNELEQEELRSLARGIEERIEVIESELEEQSEAGDND